MVIAVVVLAAHVDETAGREALAVLAPVMEPLAEAGRQVDGTARPLILWGGWAAAAALGATALRRHAESWRALLVVMGLAGAAQLALLADWVAAGAAAWAVAGVLALAWHRRLAAGIEGGAASSPAWTAADSAYLVAIAALSATLRTYALTTIPDSIDGEVAGFWNGATTLRGILLANEAVDGAWAPLGLLYYLPIYGVFQVTGSTLLGVRLASAGVAILTTAVIFHVARRLFGRSAAVLAALFYTLEPLQIGWGRSDVYPHHATSWVGLLLILATVRAIESGSARRWWGVAALQALAWHQYPSGQVAVLLPVVLLALHLLRGGGRGGAWRRPATAVLAGVLAWGAGGVALTAAVTGEVSLTRYLDRLGPRVHVQQDETPRPLTARLAAAGATSIRHAADLARGLTHEAPYLFHQDLVNPTSNLRTRTAAWAVVALGLPLLVVGLACPAATRLAAVAWLAVLATLPAVFSDAAYPKRASLLFPALCILAGVGGAMLLAAIRQAWGRRAVPVARALAVPTFALWLCLDCFLFFSGERLRRGPVGDVEAARRIAAEIVPGTVVVGRFAHSWSEGLFAFLLRDALTDPRRAPALVYLSYDEPEAWRAMLADPGRVAARILEHPPYYLSWGAVPVDESYWRRESAIRRVVHVVSVDDWPAGAPTASDDLLAAGLQPRPLRLGPERRNYFWWVDVAVHDLAAGEPPGR